MHYRFITLSTAVLSSIITVPIVSASPIPDSDFTHRFIQTTGAWDTSNSSQVPDIWDTGSNPDSGSALVKFHNGASARAATLTFSGYAGGFTIDQNAASVIVNNDRSISLFPSVATESTIDADSQGLTLGVERFGGTARLLSAFGNTNATVVNHGSIDLYNGSIQNLKVVNDGHIYGGYASGSGSEDLRGVTLDNTNGTLAGGVASLDIHSSTITGGDLIGDGSKRLFFKGGTVIDNSVIKGINRSEHQVEGNVTFRDVFVEEDGTGQGGALRISGDSSTELTLQGTNTFDRNIFNYRTISMDGAVLDGGNMISDLYNYNYGSGGMVEGFGTLKSIDLRNNRGSQAGGVSAEGGDIEYMDATLYGGLLTGTGVHRALNGARGGAVRFEDIKVDAGARLENTSDSSLTLSGANIIIDGSLTNRRQDYTKSINIGTGASDPGTNIGGSGTIVNPDKGAIVDFYNGSWDSYPGAEINIAQLVNQGRIYSKKLSFTGLEVDNAGGTILTDPAIGGPTSISFNTNLTGGDIYADTGGTVYYDGGAINSATLGQASGYSAGKHIVRKDTTFRDVTFAYLEDFEIESGAVATFSGVFDGTYSNTIKGDITCSGADAKFHGIGHIDGTITIEDGCSLAPGSSPGRQLVNDSIWGDAGGFLFEINDPYGTAGPVIDSGWDFLEILNTLIVDASALNPFIIDIDSVGLGANDNTKMQFDPTTAFDPLQSYSWQFLSAATIAGFAPEKFAFDFSDFQNDNGLAAGSFTFSISQSSEGLFLNFTPTAAAPVPASISLFGLGFVVLAGISRRGRPIRFTNAI